MKFAENYWVDRHFSEKYYWQTQIFIDFFEPKKVIDIGCGKGFFVHAFEYYGIPARGYDISVFAISHPYELSKGKLYHMDSLLRQKKTADLVVCYDVLEHVPIEELDSFVKALISIGTKNFLFSICMAGDSNWDKDPTHVTKRTKEWWINFFTELGLIHVETPEDFLFANQILIFKKVVK